MKLLPLPVTYYCWKDVHYCLYRSARVINDRLISSEKSSRIIFSIFTDCSQSYSRLGLKQIWESPHSHFHWQSCEDKFISWKGNIRMLLSALEEILLKQLLIIQLFIKYSVHSGNYLLLLAPSCLRICYITLLFRCGFGISIGRHNMVLCTCCVEVPLNTRGDGLPED